MIRIAIVVGSTRPGRRGDQVARWVHEQATALATQDAGVEYAIVDLAEVGH
uniref:NADPH-dependent FMN reductase n=1 Tax=Luteococcus sp. TaxID=1969402 RepID=UPI0037356F7D